jgi:membrane protein implicated in regulation of membrane protease activity
VTAAYVLVIFGMLGLSNAAAEWFFVAEIATMPTGIFWFLGGASIVVAIGSLLGWAGAVVLYGAFAMSAVMNAVLLREVARALRQRCGTATKYSNQPTHTGPDPAG